MRVHDNPSAAVSRYSDDWTAHILDAGGMYRGVPRSGFTDTAQLEQVSWSLTQVYLSLIFPCSSGWGIKVLTII